MLIRSRATTLLQMFCELSLYSQVIFKSMRVADDTFWRNGLTYYCSQLAAKSSLIIWCRSIRQKHSQKNICRGNVDWNTTNISAPSNILLKHFYFPRYCQKYHRSRCQFLNEPLSMNELTHSCLEIRIIVIWVNITLESNFGNNHLFTKYSPLSIFWKMHFFCHIPAKLWLVSC